MTIPKRHIFVNDGKNVEKFTFKDEKKASRFMEKQRAKGLIIVACCY